MTRIILVRHGESVANQECRFAGSGVDAALLDRGLRQAERMADYVAKHYAVSRVYTSGLQRAYITGKCVADRFGLEVTVLEGLREIYGGFWEDCPFEDMGRLYPEEYRLWMTRRESSRCPGGESVAEVAERVTAAMVRIAEENSGKTALMVSHATPIHLMCALARNGSLKDMNSVPLAPNASLTVLCYEDGEWSYEGCIDSYLGELKTELPKNV